MLQPWHSGQTMKTRRKNRYKKASLQRLVRIAVRNWFAQEGENAISELQKRGSPQTLELTRNLCRSSHPRRRGLGMRLALQMYRREGGRMVIYATEACLPLLFAGLRDPLPDVIASAITGFAYRHHPAAVSDIVQLSTHSDAHVRWAVAFTLACYTQPESVATLLRLMSDSDDYVRDYATWALANMPEVDTPEIRAALWRNVDDRDEHVRAEALDGLAQRGDVGLIPCLRSRLTPDCPICVLTAAQTLASPVLLPALLALQAQCGKPADGPARYWRDRLEDAIAACAARTAEPGRTDTAS